MHIPALDSLRHERVGIISDGDVSLVVKAYVKTEDTEERGAYDPVEGMSRPFPMLMHAETPTVIEPMIETGKLREFSDGLIEYTSLVYESMVEGEWVDGFDGFDESDFSEEEYGIAHTIMSFASQEPPKTLWRTVYEQANKLVTSDEDSVEIVDNPLRDIDGRERYQFSYIPPIDDVDAWELVRYTHKSETESGETIASESLWLRYQVGDIEEERPLIVFQNENAGFSAASPSVEYGSNEMDSVNTEIINSILGEEPSKPVLSEVSFEEIEGTRTAEYLRAYTDE